jgi:mxaD protein
MTGARAEVTIDKPADEVWALISDFGNLSWIPNAKSLQLDGDIRTFQLGDSIVKHRLLLHDDAARSYTYALASDVAADSGEVVRATEATISVVPDGPSASTVTWSSETEERTGSPEGLGTFFQGILDHVKRQLEHA